MSRMEVISSLEWHRRWSDDQKWAIIVEAVALWRVCQGVLSHSPEGVARRPHHLVGLPPIPSGAEKIWPKVSLESAPDARICRDHPRARGSHEQAAIGKIRRSPV